MNVVVIRNIFRFLGLVLIQVLVFKRVEFPGDVLRHLAIFVYPVFLFLLPIRTPHAFLVFLGFILGLTIDLFYDSPGVHAAAGTFAGFIRPMVLSALEPRGGYKINQSPTKYRFGLRWFLTYVSIMLFLHLLVLFIVEAFSFYYLEDIILRTLLSFSASLVFIMAYQFLVNPKD